MGLQSAEAEPVVSRARSAEAPSERASAACGVCGSSMFVILMKTPHVGCPEKQGWRKGVRTSRWAVEAWGQLSGRLPGASRLI